MAELDVAALRFDGRRVRAVRVTVEGLGVAYVEPTQWAAILDALERADEVAEQGCEFCDAMVDDWGEERDGGREPHASWWACGKCWNASARETGTIIGHLSDLLDRALERGSDLEAEIKGLWDEGQALSRDLLAYATEINDLRAARG